MSKWLTFASREEQRAWARGDDTEVAQGTLDDERQRLDDLKATYSVMCEAAGHTFECDATGIWEDMLVTAIELGWSAKKLQRKCLEVIAAHSVGD